MDLHRALRQRKLSLVVCVCLLGGYGLLPQNAVSAELVVVSSLANTTLGSPFDLSLLQGYLDLDRQKTMLSGVKGFAQPTEWKLPLMAENGRALPFILDNTQARFEARFEGNNVSFDELDFIFLRNFSKKDKLITINPFSVPSVSLVLPAKRKKKQVLH